MPLQRCCHVSDQLKIYTNILFYFDNGKAPWVLKVVYEPSIPIKNLYF